MGQYCLGREEKERLPNGIPTEEIIVIESERKIMLQRVPYEVFRGAIKRHGYCGDLSEKHMRQISPEILCNYEEMMQSDKSPFAIVYQDLEFKSKDKRHSVKHLLRLGWLLCKHQSREL